MKKVLTLLALGLAINAFATPSEIVIVRHADKLDQKEHGPVLDPTGYLRAITLADYIQKNYSNPDFLIAANPNIKKSHVASIRELQTIAPLANMLQQQNPQKKYTILDPYQVPKYPKLAQFILKAPQFDHKKILIVWDHFTIPGLVNQLGVAEKQPVWPGDDFDSVYVLKYDAAGKLVSYQFLHNQYPVPAIKNWQEYLTKMATN